MFMKSIFQIVKACAVWPCFPKKVIFSNDINFDTVHNHTDINLVFRDYTKIRLLILCPIIKKEYLKKNLEVKITQLLKY